MKNIKTTLLVDGNITATKLKSLSSVQISDDTDTASESKVGCIRYRDSETGSYLEMCMQVDTGVYS
jgi:hypothetical protein